MAELDWDTSKENVQPLKHGRNLAQLKVTKPSIRKGEVEEQRRYRPVPLVDDFLSSNGLLVNSYRACPQVVPERDFSLFRRRPARSLGQVITVVEVQKAQQKAVSTFIACTSTTCF